MIEICIFLYVSGYIFMIGMVRCEYSAFVEPDSILWWLAALIWPLVSIMIVCGLFERLINTIKKNHFGD